VECHCTADEPNQQIGNDNPESAVEAGAHHFIVVDPPHALEDGEKVEEKVICEGDVDHCGHGLEGTIRPGVNSEGRPVVLKVSFDESDSEDGNANDSQKRPNLKLLDFADEGEEKQQAF
jgi:hypothetical protein